MALALARLRCQRTGDPPQERTGPWQPARDKDFPSYGVQVTGPAGNSSQVILSDVSGYGTPISYPLVATLLSCNLGSSCKNVSGQLGV
jgi:hypothetical protein